MSKSNLVASSASHRKIDPKIISIKPPNHRRAVFMDAALHWYRFGLDVIPIVPGAKKPAVKWDPWLNGLSEANITRYWRKHPTHEVGFIVSDDLIVFDADTPQSLSRLCELEQAFDISPSLTVKTSKGEHHYFRRTAGVLAKSDSHSSEKFPERIDVKTGRALIVLPPSGGREVLVDES